MATRAQLLAPLLAPLLMHPVESPVAAAAGTAAALADLAPEAALELERLLDALAQFDLGVQQELHGRTFDLSPSCTPFLSVHIFGDESFKRAELMAGLACVYAAAGYDTGGEVTDHLGVVLRFAPQFSDEEWEEIGRYCLGPALAAMRHHLASTTNPYSHLMNAVVHLLATDFPNLLKEKSCPTSSFLAPSHILPFSASSSEACGGCGQTHSASPPCHPSSLRVPN